MLFFWFRLFVARVVWLFRMPKPEDVARVERNVPCPVCGARRGTIRCVPRTNAASQALILVQHACQECGARWHEKPVMKVTPNLVFPSVPRTELEQWEDKYSAVVLPPEGIQ